uniref:Uncharacterized protein LOC114346705 n=1 Tax=Diabrotica virgifera virgifera TaxID=50390 RepID=A0A6P7H6B1_DIAVI
MELSEDSIKRIQNVLVCDKHGDSLEQYVNVQIKSELEECSLTNYAENSLSDSYCSDDIKIEEHMLQDDNIFHGITMQEVKTEIKQELDEHNLVNHGCDDLFHNPNTKELDSERDVKLEIEASTEIDHERHCRSMKTSKLLSNIDTDTERKFLSMYRFNECV